MTDSDRIVEIGARVLFEDTQVGRWKLYGYAQKQWGDEPESEKRCIRQMRAVLAAFEEAGLVVEQGWQPIETAVEGDGAVKIGAASGVSFHMLYVRKARWEHSGVEAEEGWFAHAYGLLCFTGSGKPIQVFPTHWRAPPAPPAAKADPQ